jgi:hypothetical protein
MSIQRVQSGAASDEDVLSAEALESVIDRVEADGDLNTILPQQFRPSRWRWSR